MAEDAAIKKKNKEIIENTDTGSIIWIKAADCSIKRIIIVQAGILPIVMINPAITKKKFPLKLKKGV